MSQTEGSSRAAPRIALLGATRRALAVLEEIEREAPGGTRAVVSFREHGTEPRYFDDLRERAVGAGARFLESRRLENAGEELSDGSLDAAFLVNWRYRIPLDALRARRGVFVFHDSLLPAYRGFSPTVWAIANGERATGATLFRIAEEVDAGPIVDQETVSIGPKETIGTVFDRVTAAYRALMARNLGAILGGRAAERPQDEALATWARRRTREDDRIDWNRPSRAIFDLVRAVTHPYPGAYGFLGGRRLTVWAAKRGTAGGRGGPRVPGRAVSAAGGGVIVETADGTLLLERVEPEGGVEARAADVLRELPAQLE